METTTDDTATAAKAVLKIWFVSHGCPKANRSIPFRGSGQPEVADSSLCNCTFVPLLYGRIFDFIPICLNE